MAYTSFISLIFKLYLVVRSWAYTIYGGIDSFIPWTNLDKLSIIE